MEAVTINWWSVLGATLVGFAVGGLWYGPFFGKAWMKASGVTEAQVAQGNMVKIFGLTFVLQLGMAYCLAMFLGNEIETATGTLYGFLTGLPWAAFAITVNALYEQRSFQYILINGGYWTVVFTLMGAILGTWPA